MRTCTTLALAGTLLVVAATAGATTRTLEGSQDAARLELVSLEAGVGDITITGTDVDRVEYEVVLKPRRGGLFSSMRSAQREVDTATLRADVVGRELRLEVRSDDDDRRFEERWTIRVPRRLALDLESGVGDVEIRDVAGGIDLEIGVGDASVEAVGGDVSVEVGVGEVGVRGIADAYGRVECEGGVGDARLLVRGERVESEGLVGHSAEWRGDGPDEINVEVGVGDAEVTLD